MPYVRLGIVLGLGLDYTLAKQARSKELGSPTRQKHPFTYVFSCRWPVCSLREDFSKWLFAVFSSFASAKEMPQDTPIPSACFRGRVRNGFSEELGLGSELVVCVTSFEASSN